MKKLILKIINRLKRGVWVNLDIIDNEFRENMKKLLLLALTALLVSCHPMEDPLKYKGCVVVGKWEQNPRLGNIYLKLTPELRKDFEEDYILIGVPEWEWQKLEIGDTIK